MQGRIESNKLQLDPWRDAAGLHVIINVENYDGSWSSSRFDFVSRVSTAVCL
jgi:hypothetical protein